MDSKKYNVIIENNPSPTEDTAEKLASLFKTPVEKAQAILLKDGFVIKKQADKATAEKSYKAVMATGTNCRIEEILQEEEETALPTIEELIPPKETQPLIDPTRPDISPLHSEQMDLSLEGGPVEKSKKDQKEDKVIDDINPENFCPECGTIRASADSICIHCGYDPEEIKGTLTKVKIINIIVGLCILIVGIFLGLPYYEQYAKRAQIETDLGLAFDTRNTVTEFIQKTNFWPNQNIDAGLPKSLENQSIESILISDNGVMTVTIRGEVLGGDSQTLIFTPNTLKGRIVWNCLKGTLIKELRPEICLVKIVE